MGEGLRWGEVLLLSITHIFVIVGDLGLRLFGLTLFLCHCCISSGSWSYLGLFVFVQRNAVKTVGTGRLEPQRGELMQPRV